MATTDGSLALEIPIYERKLRTHRAWAMDEGDRHFGRQGEVFKTLRQVTQRLESLGIPHAVVGGLALDAHGFRRLTVDVDILVTRESLKKIHDHLDGRGYLPPFEKSKHLRDTDNGVRIEFLTTGDFPGDGKPKPVAFPDPAAVSVEIEGVKYINLPTLVELKLASGISNPGRLKDISDIQEAIKALGLHRDFAEQLNPYVREKYLEIWDGLQNGPNWDY
ncbi:MAG: hypothetical protein NVSMB14_09760 [Isosphaeraceae bacterium]